MRDQSAAALARTLRNIINLAQKALRENKLPEPPGRGDHFTPKLQAKILKLDQSGMSASKIARQIGRSQPGVSSFLRKHRRTLRERVWPDRP